MEIVLENTADHRAYLAELHAAGKLLASGPFVPRTGGLLLFRVGSRTELDEIVARDPFFARGVASYDLREWAPTLGKEWLEAGAK